MKLDINDWKGKYLGLKKIKREQKGKRKVVLMVLTFMHSVFKQLTYLCLSVCVCVCVYIYRNPIAKLGCS